MCVVAEVAKAFVSATTTLNKINLSRKKKIMIYVGIYNYSSVPYLQLFFLYNKLVSIILFTSSTCKMKLFFFFFFFLT